MAIIPLGNFGREEPRQTRPADTSAVAEGLRSFGNAGFDLARNLQAQREESARATAANLKIRHDLAVDEAFIDVQGKLERKELKADDAPAAYRDRISQFEVPQIGYLHPEASQALRLGIDGARNAGGLRIEQLASRARQGENLDNYQQSLQTLQARADLPGADLPGIHAQADQLRAMGRMGGRSDADISGDLEGFKAKGWFQHARSRLLDAGEDIDKLRALRSELISRKGFYADKLNTDARNDLRTGIESEIDRQKARAERAAEVRYNSAARNLSALQSLSMSGLPISVERMAEAKSMVRGVPGLESELRGIIDSTRAIQSVLQRPLGDQLSALADMERTQSTVGVSSAAEIIALNRLRAAVTTNIQRVQSEPLVVRAERGEADIPRVNMAQMLASKGQSAAPAFEARIVELQSMRRQYGAAVGQAVLLPEDISNVRGALSGADTGDKQALIYGALKNAIVRNGGDLAYYRAAIKQLAGQSTTDAAVVVDPVVLQAGLLYGTNPAAAAAMLRGRTIDHKIDPVKAEDLRVSMNDIVGDAFRNRPAALSAASAAVGAYYRERRSQQGAGDGVVDGTLLREAIEATQGTPTSWGDHDVLMPVGMGRDEFEQRVRTQWQAQTKSRNLPGNVVESLEDYTLEQRDGHTYRVLDAYDQPVGGARNPILLRIDQNTPQPKRSTAPHSGMPAMMVQ